MGKTTLAQFVCQDKKVQNHFGDMIIWVHVPKRFKLVDLVRKMLESINRNKATTSALDTLQLDLSKELVTRKNDIWGHFLAPLRNNASVGGRILLTTRMGSVANAVEHQMPTDGYKCVKLGGLDNRDIVQILNHHASPNGDLDIIAERIVRNLEGCPFVAKVIGQCLRDNTGHTNWDDFLNKKECRLGDIAPRVMEMLSLRYEDLTLEVQICFQYCSIFPYHYKFRMEELTEMWMSSGLILQSTKGKNDQEKNARDHFNILLKKSFFSLIPRELHPHLIYEIEEFSRFKDTEHNTADVSERVRHLYIEGINPEVVKVISKSTYLRTLIMANEEWPLEKGLADNFKKAIKCVTSLRLLRFDGNGWFDINDAISELKHLRYISMSATSKSNLNELFKLFHLEVLKLLKIEGVEQASVSDICKLPNLQKLYLPKLALSRVPHIGRLTNLQELNGLSVRKEEGYKISELKELNKLQKVFVFDVENVNDCSEASSAELSNKKDMELLSLEWSNRHNRINERILDTLVPCKRIRHLQISGYKGLLPPLWIQRKILTKLVHLKIVGCLKWDKLPSLASLSSLKHVLLEDLPNLKYIGGPDGDGLPPFLVTLVVKECLQLLNLPPLPSGLKHLRIHEVGISCLPASNQMALQNFSTLDPQLCSIDVDSCPNFFSFGSCIIEEEHYKALASLKVVCCSMLKNLPNEEHFRRMSTLERIEVLQCQNLSTLGGLGALSSLKILKIQKCTGLTATSSGIRVAPATRSTLVIDTLEIDDHLLLLENPFRNFYFTRSLIISDGSKMSELPQDWLLQNRSHLEHIKIINAILLSSLPSSMDTFHSLRSLVQCNAPVLQSLPAMPPNLWALHISDCSIHLKDGCKINGSEWEKILSIHNRLLQDLSKVRDEHRLYVNYQGEEIFSHAVVYLEDAIDDIEYRKLEEVRNPTHRNFNTKLSVPSPARTQLEHAIRILESVVRDMPFRRSSRLDYNYYENRMVLFGRDREQQQIVQWLIEEPRPISRNHPCSIFAIVGMGGMGKTDLARLAYYDWKVRMKLDSFAWVSVHDYFSAEEITWDIVASVTGGLTTRQETPAADNIRYNKLLLVLDDVWEDNSLEEWKSLSDSLTDCRPGSRILLTTRMQSVADMAADGLGVEAECLKLGELDEIANRIGGCPLLTIRVASQLTRNMNLQHWNTVLQEGWQHVTDFDFLTTTYNHLPIELQTCFRYCKPSNGDQKEYYVLHGLMHDMAQYVSRGECARVDKDDFRNAKLTTKHLSIVNCRNLNQISDLKYLRNLIIQNV
uniref:NB-ARC domain-containing protein n=1 Tax=Leersia perrieri TaxID=77586 RepID=A0A0D9XZS7_9ORYZ